MSRRCKPGQRAKVTSEGNRGRIVLVVGYYFSRMKWGDCDVWHIDFFPWKVLSLGPPLNTWDAITGECLNTDMQCVIDDADLEPLDDDDDGLIQSTETKKAAAV